MPDFSYLSHPPLSEYLRLIEAGKGLFVSDCRRAVQLFDPPLLDAASMAALDYCLSEPLKGPQGRPPAAHTRLGLSKQLERLSRPDAPAMLIRAVVQHLRTTPETPANNLRKLRTALSKRRKEDRVSLMVAVYNQLQMGSADMLPELAAWRARQPSLAERPTKAAALELTQRLLHDLNYYPPELPRMRNIISQRRKSLENVIRGWAIQR